MRTPYLIRDETCELTTAVREATSELVCELKYMPFVSIEVEEGMRLHRFKFRRRDGETASVVSFMLLDFESLQQATVKIVFRGVISTSGLAKDTDLIEHLRQEFGNAAIQEIDALFSALA